jgi:hypothetical protein
MFDEVEKNESVGENDWSPEFGRHFLNKWVSHENKVYQINEVVFIDEDERELPTNDPVSIDLVIQMNTTGQNDEEEIYGQVIERGQELFGDNTVWEFEVNETEVVCLV